MRRPLFAPRRRHTTRLTASSLSLVFTFLAVYPELVACRSSFLAAPAISGELSQLVHVVLPRVGAVSGVVLSIVAETASPLAHRPGNADFDTVPLLPAIAFIALALAASSVADELIPPPASSVLEAVVVRLADGRDPRPEPLPATARLLHSAKSVNAELAVDRHPQERSIQQVDELGLLGGVVQDRPRGPCAAPACVSTMDTPVPARVTDTVPIERLRPGQDEGLDGVSSKLVL